MTYIIRFREDALKEWNKLDKTIQQQFAKKLYKRCENPHISPVSLRSIKGLYKIKLQNTGFQLVYQVMDNQLIIAIVAAGKRNCSDVYQLTSKRMR